MSFHRNPKYQIPALIQALKDHGLEHDTPSQLSDAFRTGWVAAQSPSQPLVEAPKPIAVVDSKAPGGRRFVGRTLEFKDLPDGTKLYAAPVRGLPLTEEQIEAAAKVLAGCMDYPWEHMPTQGRITMHQHAKSVIEAAHGIGSPAPGGDGEKHE